MRWEPLRLLLSYSAGEVFPWASLPPFPLFPLRPCLQRWREGGESRVEIGPRRRFFSFHFIFNLFRFPFGKKRRRERSGEKRRKREFLGEILPGKQKKESLWGEGETEPIGGRRRGKKFFHVWRENPERIGESSSLFPCVIRDRLLFVWGYFPLLHE